MADKALREVMRAFEGAKARNRHEGEAIAVARRMVERALEESESFEQKGHVSDLRALEAMGIAIRAPTRKAKAAAATGLRRIMGSGGLESRLMSIGAYRGYRISSASHHGGRTGAYRIGLAARGKKAKTVFVKSGNGSAEVLGARIAAAAGLTIPKVYHGRKKAGPDFAIIEDVHDFAGKTARVRCFEGAKTFRVSSVGLVLDELLRPSGYGRPNEATADFWNLMEAEEGGKRFINAWLDFQEFSRLGLLCDRRAINAAVAFQKKDGRVDDACIISIDFEAVAFGLGADGRDALLDGFYCQIAMNTHWLMTEIASASVKAAKAGLIRSPFTSGMLLEETGQELSRRRAEEPAGYTMLAGRVAGKITRLGATGARFGVLRDSQGIHETLTREKAERLAVVVGRMASPAERRRFIDSQLASFRALGKMPV